jgi:hypothetical protein
MELAKGKGGFMSSTACPQLSCRAFGVLSRVCSCPIGQNLGGRGEEKESSNARTMVVLLSGHPLHDGRNSTDNKRGLYTIVFPLEESCASTVGCHCPRSAVHRSACLDIIGSCGRSRTT